MTYKPIPTKPLIKGLNACTDYATQPPGSFPRGSNLLLNKRGALDVCDGTQLIHAFNGAVQSGRGQMLVAFLFSPTGVPSYYLALAQALDLPLGPPQNLTVVGGGSGGTLPAGTYYYKVTALDGVGGETTASNEVSVTITLGQEPVLTWNIVPNAAAYNIYRGMAPGAETLLSGTGLPAPQNGVGNLTVSFTDNGTFSAIVTSYNLAPTPSGAVVVSYPGFGGNPAHAQFNFRTTAPITTLGTAFVIAGATIPFNGTYAPPTYTISGLGTLVNAFRPGFGGNATGGFGTLTFISTPPLVDTTQQIVLFKMPLILGSPAILPVAYNDSNIVAIFPALLVTFASVGGGGGGSGGGGGTGGGGSGGPGPSGGRPITVV